MTSRKPEKLRDQSIHVLWTLRQLVMLAEHLEDRHRQGVAVMVDPLDAAALEAFCVHARALIEFLWRDRRARGDGRPAPRRENAVAADWFASGEWAYEARLPTELRDVANRTGWGVAHISYDRLRVGATPGWDHDGITHRIAYRLASFAADVSDSLVTPGFRAEADRIIIRWRAASSTGIVAHAPNLSATPVDVSVWSRLPT